MRILLSIFGGLLCVSAVFTGLASTLNVFHQMDVRVENNIDRMNTAHDVNVYETACRMGVGDETQDHSVIPPYFLSCTLGENRLTRPPYYGENISDHDWRYGFWEEPKFPEPTLLAPTLVELRPQVLCLDCVGE